jgi:CheY-like chemotaxis protein
MKDIEPVTLLLVEDDQVDVKAVKRAFEELRIANPLVVAKDGIEALDILRGKDGKKKLTRLYLVLLDLNMPRMSGIEFLDELRKDSSLDSTIVFVLTTSEAERDRLQAYERHVSGYVLKQRAGPSFVDAISMLEHYWRIVELPAA